MAATDEEIKTLARLESMRDSIEEMRGELLTLQTDYLRKAGWEYTCNVPGSLWMWSKSLPDGRVILVNNENTAMSIEESI